MYDNYRVDVFGILETVLPCECVRIYKRGEDDGLTLAYEGINNIGHVPDDVAEMQVETLTVEKGVLTVTAIKWDEYGTYDEDEGFITGGHVFASVYPNRRIKIFEKYPNEDRRKAYDNFPNKETIWNELGILPVVGITVENDVLTVILEV